METYTDPKPLRHTPKFKADKLVALDNLDINLVDSPLVKLIYDIKIA